MPSATPATWAKTALAAAVAIMAGVSVAIAIGAFA
jgi:hypothetical protein